MFAEPKFFDDEREAAARRTEKRKETAEKKAAEKEASKRKRGGEDGGRARKTCHTCGQNDVTEEQCDESRVAVRPVRNKTLLEELSEYERLRVEYEQAVGAARATQEDRKKSAKAACIDNLAPELDHFVNAAMRSTKCYRKPIAAYYENDRIGMGLSFSFISVRLADEPE